MGMGIGLVRARVLFRKPRRESERTIERPAQSATWWVLDRWTGVPAYRIPGKEPPHGSFHKHRDAVRNATQSSVRNISLWGVDSILVLAIVNTD